MGALKITVVSVSPETARPLEYVRISFETRHMDTDALTTPSTSNKITIWDVDATTELAAAVAVTQDSGGLAHYDYRLLATQTPGVLFFRIDADNGGGANVNSKYGQIVAAWS